MASLQYSSASWVAQYREFRPLTIVQPGNNGRHSINLVTKHPNSILKFSQISYDIKYNSKGNEWRVCCRNDGSCGIAPQWSTPSVLHLVQEFYTAINVKNTHKLDQLLSNDCIFQDLIFYIPFGGKESIMNFLQNLMEAMGQNVHFVIDSWTQGGTLTASVIWHLEWKGKEIYHIRQVAISLNVNRLMESLLSVSISTIHVISTLHYQFKKIDNLLIRSKITGVEEFSVKPGDWVLKLLKATIVAFDKFPSPAERM
ncbi:hypothetical protein J1N35_013657 [Gossypium stocksii]|uniref:SnoaL-like domain-containing protein n=1 Tax=Gossypium stocksii TaxID=47602 RepID=A0A9D3VVD6_9ROSI|nr:hypothetical protein J1N35_013657 [Gossypium stocksii]